MARQNGYLHAETTATAMHQVNYTGNIFRCKISKKKGVQIKKVHNGYQSGD